MKRFHFWALIAALFAVLLVGCKQEPKQEEVTLEAFIKTIQIVNAGISGGDMITGEVDNTKMVITFNDVPAESNISAIKVKATTSLGASLEQDTYDFTVGNNPDSKELTTTMVCTNKTDKASKSETYTAILKLKDPASAPVIEKIVLKDDKGTEVTVTSTNIMEGLLCLGMPESSTATIVSVALSPARATYTFTTAADGVISASNPGFFQMEFMGLKSDQYEVTFASSPTPGADFSEAVVHDFSIVTGNVYADLVEEFTRGGDFDGKYVLLANRTAPKLFAVEDLLNDNTSNPILLDITGVEGGTHVISAGRLAQGHIYLCNLCAEGADWTETGGFRIYHYASPTATPEVVLDWNGTGITNSENDYTARLGDNMSISLDESGNGYAFFFKQEADNKFFRFKVTGFTNFSEPTELTLPATSNYYGMMNPVGPNQYLFTSSYVAMMWLLDADATMLREFEWATTPSGVSVNHGCDPRVIEFNRSRYLMLSNARRFLYWPEEGVHVFDISEGNDIVSAMVKMQERQDLDETDPNVLEPCYSYVMPGEAISAACVALCNAAEVNGKLVIWAAAPHVGMCLIEVPKMK